MLRFFCLSELQGWKLVVLQSCQAGCKAQERMQTAKRMMAVQRSLLQVGDHDGLHEPQLITPATSEAGFLVDGAFTLLHN